VLLPAGPKVAFTGGLDFNDHRAIWDRLDQAHAKHPGMVLLHGGSPKGAERIAAAWANARKVTQIAFKPDWTRHAKAAPFRRNDQMLAVMPIGVVDFQGHLHQSVFERRDARRPELSRLAGLRDQPLAHQLGAVVSAAQFLSDILKKPLHTALPLFDLAPRHPIRAGCPAPRVASEPLPSMAERAAITYPIEQVRESFVGIRVTPPVQLALHVEDERSIRRAGPSTHLLLACRTTHSGQIAIVCPDRYTAVTAIAANASPSPGNTFHGFPLLPNAASEDGIPAQSLSCYASMPKWRSWGENNLLSPADRQQMVTPSSLGMRQRAEAG
jgi:hypothetical protein